MVGGIVDGSESGSTVGFHPSSGMAFFLTFLSMICWGSWSNSAKEAEKRSVPFPHFYTDYVFAIFVSSIVYWVLLADAEMDFHCLGNSVDHWRVLSSVAAGCIFNVANVLMVHGINIAGLSVAFPLAIGTSLVGGTILIYFVDVNQRPSSPAKLFLGVAAGFAAVVCIAIADRLKQASAPGARQGLQEYMNQPINSSVAKASSPAASAAVCLVSGLLMSCWPPLSAYAQDKTGVNPTRSSQSSTPFPPFSRLLTEFCCWAAVGTLNPYFAFMLFSGATLLTTLKPSPVAIFLFWCEDNTVEGGTDSRAVTSPGEC